MKYLFLHIILVITKNVQHTKSNYVINIIIYFYFTVFNIIFMAADKFFYYKLKLYLSK